MAQRRKAQALRQAEIVQAAIRCLARDGYAGVTLRTVAAEANLNQGLLHHHFKTKTLRAKQAILHAALSATLARFYGLVDRIVASKDPQAALRILIHGLLELDEDTRVVLLQFWSGGMRDRIMGRFTADMYHDLRKVLERLIERGVKARVFRRTKPEEASRIILSLAEGMALQRTIDQGAVSTQEATRLCIGAAHDYLSRPQAPTRAHKGAHDG